MDNSANPRLVVVLARRSAAAWAPPGVDAGALHLAGVEDVYETISSLELVRACVACWSADRDAVTGLTWPGTPIIEIAPDGDREAIQDVLARAAELGATQAVVVAGDAPDLPGLLIGKLFRGLATASVAVCPAQDGGLVAIAANLPLAGWAADAAVGLDTADALAALRAAAPRRRDLHVAPGWHRLRSQSDLARLDPGLEGWESTRALLSQGPVRS